MLENQIEAILFVKGEPVAIYELARLLGVDPDIVEGALVNLEDRLRGGGVRLMRHDYFVELRTAPEYSDLVEELLAEDTNRELSVAAQETLSIVLYSGSASAHDIDLVRGVNCRNILRSLCARGLIRREHDKSKNRNVYKPSMDLLAHLGISSMDDISQYAEISAQIKKFANECSA